jgi:hypothetical protein
MATLTWKDSRLPANDVAPWDTTVMFVGPTTPLAEMVADSVKWCKEHGPSMDLMIYCHGSAGYLEICKEDITVKNLNMLAPLRPYFDAVSIHACEIALGTVGKAFCTKMALVLLAPVAGAVSDQENKGLVVLAGSLDDKKFEGDYYNHLPSGARQGPLRSR